MTSVRGIVKVKRAWRRRLAALSIERKVEILIRLQKMAREIGAAVGRPTRRPWGETE